MKNEKAVLDLAYKSILKCKELIFYGVQLSDAVQRGSIQPEYFEKMLIVPEPHSRNGFCINLDWTKHVEIFKETADDALIHIASFAIIVCKESYPEVLWVNEKDNSDLYAAQMILKFVRDAMGHMRVSSVTGAMPYWTNQLKNNRKIYKIQSLNFTLDAHDLHDKQFKFSHIGGISNLLSILDYRCRTSKSVSQSAFDLLTSKWLTEKVPPSFCRDNGIVTPLKNSSDSTDANIYSKLCPGPAAGPNRCPRLL